MLRKCLNHLLLSASSSRWWSSSSTSPSTRPWPSWPAPSQSAGQTLSGSQSCSSLCSLPLHNWDTCFLEVRSGGCFKCLAAILFTFLLTHWLFDDSLNEHTDGQSLTSLFCIYSVLRNTLWSGSNPQYIRNIVNSGWRLQHFRRRHLYASSNHPRRFRLQLNRAG